MSTPTGLGDLTEYVATIWGGRKIIFAVTAGSALVMALLTMALPKLYIVRSVVDAGVLPDVQPRELNLFVDAVARNEFVVEGGRFADSLTDSLTATFRPPSSIELAARSANPASAAQRLTVLTAGVLAELEKTFKTVAGPRAAPGGRVATLLEEAAARATTLASVFEERRDSAVGLAVAAREAAVREAQKRDALRAAAASRYAGPLRSISYTGVPAVDAAAREVGNWLRDDAPAPNVVDVLEADHRRWPWITTLGSVPAFSSLAALSAQLASSDLQLIGAVQTRDAADALHQREERAIQVLSASPTDAASAARMQEALDALAAEYQSPSEAGVVAQLREMSAVLASVAAADADAQAVLQRMVPHIVTPPAVPTVPAGPRPVVSITVATLVALVGSALVVSIRGRKSEDSPG